MSLFASRRRQLHQKGTASGRLILALDATMSRQPTWDMACRLQGEMFDAAGNSGGLEVQLTYFRGIRRVSGIEVRARYGVAQRSDDPHRLPRRQHPDRQGAGTRSQGSSAAKGRCVGLYRRRDGGRDRRAGRTRQDGSVFAAFRYLCFRRVANATAEAAFREIARLSNGAWFRFDRNAAARLAKLLSSVAIFAAGGLKALEARNLPEDRMLIEHMRASR